MTSDVESHCSERRLGASRGKTRRGPVYARAQYRLRHARSVRVAFNEVRAGLLVFVCFVGYGDRRRIFPVLLRLIDPPPLEGRCAAIQFPCAANSKGRRRTISYYFLLRSICGHGFSKLAMLDGGRRPSDNAGALQQDFDDVHVPRLRCWRIDEL